MDELKAAYVASTQGRWSYTKDGYICHLTGFKVNEFARVTKLPEADARFCALAHNEMSRLMRCAEFLADAMPGIEAYASSLTNEDYRSMWFNQIAKYKQVLKDLGLAIMRAPSNRRPS